MKGVADVSPVRSWRIFEWSGIERPPTGKPCEVHQSFFSKFKRFRAVASRFVRQGEYDLGLISFSQILGARDETASYNAPRTL